MIGTQPRQVLAPLNYRYALDAAMSALDDKNASIVLCNVPKLMGEITQRLILRTEGPSPGALWVEPIVETWRAELQALVAALPDGAAVAIIISRPLALLLPLLHPRNRRLLGLQPAGVQQLCRALPRNGLVLERAYGIHSLYAIALNTLSQQCERWGRPDLGDRLHFAARLKYCTRGHFAGLSTTALLVARKMDTSCSKQLPQH